MNMKVKTHNDRAYYPKGHPPDFTYDINELREKIIA